MRFAPLPLEPLVQLRLGVPHVALGVDELQEVAPLVYRRAPMRGKVTCEQQA